MYQRHSLPKTQKLDMINFYVSDVKYIQQLRQQWKYSSMLLHFVMQRINAMISHRQAAFPTVLAYTGELTESSRLNHRVVYSCTKVFVLPTERERLIQIRQRNMLRSHREHVTPYLGEVAREKCESVGNAPWSSAWTAGVCLAHFWKWSNVKASP